MLILSNFNCSTLSLLKLFVLIYLAFTATRSGAMDIARSSGLPDMRNVTADGWNNIGLRITDLRGKANERSTSFKHEQSLDKQMDLWNIRSILSSRSQSVLQCLEKFQSRFRHPPNGMQTATVQLTF